MPSVFTEGLAKLTTAAKWRKKLGLGNIPEYADDAAAAVGGVSIGGIYRTGSVIKIRVA